MNPALRIMIDAALEAGTEIEALYTKGYATQWKLDGSPVTEADHRAEAIILSRLIHAFPDIPIIAEEEASAGRIPALGERFFLVDALDGTKGFIARNGEFTVNIALIDKHEAIVGVIYAPDHHLLYYGAQDEGAFRCRDNGEHDPVCTRLAPATGLAALTSRAISSNAKTRLAHLPIESFTPFSSSLKFCMLAEGAADLYPRYGPTMEWDTAAGQAILEAAGGRVMAMEGDQETGPLRYGKIEREFVNPPFIAWGSQARETIV